METNEMSEDLKDFLSDYLPKGSNEGDKEEKKEEKGEVEGKKEIEKKEEETERVEKGEKKIEEKEGEEKKEEKKEDDTPTIKQLLEKIDSLEKSLREEKEIEKKDKGEKKEEKKPAILEFVKDDEEFEEITRSREKFNSFMSEVVDQIKESAMRELPGMAAKLAEGSLATKRAVDEFYSNNPDLKKIAGYVSVEATRLNGEHPEWDINKLLTETEKVVRNNLNLEKRAEKVEKKSEEKEGKPAFAEQKHGKKRQEEEVTGLAAEIKSLL